MERDTSSILAAGAGWGGLTAAVVAALVSLEWSRRRADTAGAAWAAQEREWRELVAARSTTPPLLPLEQEVAALRQQTEAWRQRWPGEVSRSVGSEPVDRTTALVTLASAVEGWRVEAKRAGVAVADAETFAFASHRQTGPEHAVLPLVLRQQRAVARFLEVLLAAQPRALVKVARERPVNNAVAGVAADFFSWDGHGSLRNRGWPEAVALRIEFLGTAEQLRRLLERAAEGAPGVVVRRVELSRPEVASGLGAAEEDLHWSVLVEVVDRPGWLDHEEVRP